MDFMLGPYVYGPPLKALTGDPHGAADRLDEGSALARALALPRLRARIDNERIRLVIDSPPHGSPPAVHLHHPPRAGRRPRRDHRSARRIVSHHETARRPQGQIATACTWAAEWVHRLQGRGRARGPAAGQPPPRAPVVTAPTKTKPSWRPSPPSAPPTPRDYLVDSGPPVATVLDALWEHRCQFLAPGLGGGTRRLPGHLCRLAAPADATRHRRLGALRRSSPESDAV